MIEYIFNHKKNKTETKVKECYDYYQNKELSFDDLYNEYDRKVYKSLIY